ncbi:MAG: (Fe-S)-binding protein [Candidatus Rokubacteria bacterium]|nr:(Fe-S)-binding protein [Candidatus Rokubacteria bacterium]
MKLGSFDLQDPPDLDGIRACVHCGICLPQCPTYRVLGEEMDSPRGRVYLMRAATEGRVGITETLTRHLDLCLGCRACETACPSGVPFGRLLEQTRGQLERYGTRSVAQRLVASLALGLFPHASRLAPALTALGFYQRSGLQRLARGSGLLRLVPRVAAMERLLPARPSTRRAALPELIPARGRRRGRAGLLLGCVQRFLFPHVNELTARLLSLAGYEVLIPPEQGCCGALHLHAGRLDKARQLARRLLVAFDREVDVVVANAAGCGAAMREYGHWLHDDSRAAAFSQAVCDVSELLADAELPLRPTEVTVTYHDPCHLSHGQRVRAQPRALLKKIPALELVELPDSELCCGSAGIYNLLEPEMADRLLELKIQRIAETGARIVATGNPGCLLQIAKGCRERGLAVELLHPVELLARALPGE